MTENEAIGTAADLLTACIPSAIAVSTGEFRASGLSLVNSMLQALECRDARLVLAVMTAIASRLVQLQAENNDTAPEDIIHAMRRVTV